VAKFVDCGGTWLEALKLALARFRGFVVHEELLGERFRGWSGLTVDEVQGKSFWVEYRDEVAAARC